MAEITSEDEIDDYYLKKHHFYPSKHGSDCLIADNENFESLCKIVIDRAENIIKKINKKLAHSYREIIKFTIGKTYARNWKNDKEKFKVEGILSRWREYEKKGYTCLLAFAIITRKNLPVQLQKKATLNSTKTLNKHENLALALESRLIQHFAYTKEDQRLGNTSLHTGQLTNEYSAGYALYIACKFDSKEKFVMNPNIELKLQMLSTDISRMKENERVKEILLLQMKEDRREIVKELERAAIKSIYVIFDGYEETRNGKIRINKTMVQRQILDKTESNVLSTYMYKVLEITSQQQIHTLKRVLKKALDLIKKIPKDVIKRKLDAVPDKLHRKGVNSLYQIYNESCLEIQQSVNKITNDTFLKMER